jgi:hypothetical protein
MRQRSKAAAAWVLALFVIWQIGASLHLVLAPHVLRADGVIADVVPNHDPEQPGRECPDPLEEECPVLSLLTGPNMLAPEGVVLWLAEQIAMPLPVQTDQPFVLDGRQLFRISPSQSPPMRV